MHKKTPSEDEVWLVEAEGLEPSSSLSCQIRTTCLGQGLSYLPKYLVPILTSLPITVSSSLLLR